MKLERQDVMVHLERQREVSASVAMFQAAHSLSLHAF
jgi:hypothetical protein